MEHVLVYGTAAGRMECCVFRCLLLQGGHGCQGTSGEACTAIKVPFRPPQGGGTLSGRCPCMLLVPQACMDSVLQLAWSAPLQHQLSHS